MDAHVGSLTDADVGNPRSTGREVVGLGVGLVCEAATCACSGPRGQQVLRGVQIGGADFVVLPATPGGLAGVPGAGAGVGAQVRGDRGGRGVYWWERRIPRTPMAGWSKPARPGFTGPTTGVSLIHRFTNGNRRSREVMMGAAWKMAGLCFGLAVLMSVPVAWADWNAKVSVAAFTVKANGQSWDPFGGAPDLAICIVTPSNPTCDAARLGFCKDQFSCSFPTPIPNGPFTIWVYDLDEVQNDVVGSAVCDASGGKMRPCVTSDRVQSLVLLP